MAIEQRDDGRWVARFVDLLGCDVVYELSRDVRTAQDAMGEAFAALESFVDDV